MNNLPLDLDLNTVDTSFPLIAQGEIVDLIVDKVESKPTAAGVQMAAVTFKTVSPTKSTKGDELQPGVTLFYNLMLGLSGKMTNDQLVKGIAGLTQAAGYTGTLGEFINGGYMSLQGKQVRAQIDYKAAGPDKKGVHRNAKNEIGLFIKQ